MMRAVDGLSPAEMAWTPNDQCSSIAFLVWHYGRTLDRWLHTRIKGEAQVWEKGWSEKDGQRSPQTPTTPDTAIPWSSFALSTLPTRERCWITWPWYAGRASTT